MVLLITVIAFPQTANHSCYHYYQSSIIKVVLLLRLSTDARKVNKKPNKLGFISLRQASRASVTTRRPTRTEASSARPKSMPARKEISSEDSEAKFNY
ncbi:hypothetical protein ElyMa_000148400 [Elysia marginata]|uniref:Uncharacterized protein n=1 Tax=Elysia marginata TaxID=1093978 RepID=A0AAV4EQ08_9GAST|nr:hypothetical protein ElyMa_000148400 [Elysia marginata]